MDTKQLLDQIGAEHPELIPAIETLTRSTGAERAAAAIVVRAVLAMQQAVNAKRVQARKMLMLRHHHLPDAKGLRQSYATRYNPDVLIYNLCALADLPYIGSATEENIQHWTNLADEMWAKSVATGGSEFLQ